MQCPACGNEHRDDERFCVNCGAALSQVCGSCGASLQAGTKFCGQCGKPVADASGGQTLVAQPAAASSQKGLPESFGDGRYQ
ncbi:MAG: zinc ribbon domain-containing protein, partial [Chloroflexi bacterium]|nr:zinc ribbon domain-containing protein [Chloroflexota bacterium]